MSARHDLTNKRFGKWLAVEIAPRHNGMTYWFCQCDCGTKQSVAASNLRSGASQSCGCAYRPTLAGIGEAITRRTIPRVQSPKARSRSIWHGMRRRCSDPEHKAYKNYGARGIQVCERWSVFDNFYADMGDPPVNKTLDRRDNDGNYEPGNCKWSTASEQGANARRTTYVYINGERRCTREVERACGLHKGQLRSRLNDGWTMERACNTPRGGDGRRARKALSLVSA